MPAGARPALRPELTASVQDALPTRKPLPPSAAGPLACPEWTVRSAPASAHAAHARHHAHSEQDEFTLRLELGSERRIARESEDFELTVGSTLFHHSPSVPVELAGPDDADDRCSVSL